MENLNCGILKGVIPFSHSIALDKDAYMQVSISKIKNPIRIMGRLIHEMKGLLNLVEIKGSKTGVTAIFSAYLSEFQQVKDGVNKFTQNEKIDSTRLRITYITALLAERRKPVSFIHQLNLTLLLSFSQNILLSSITTTKQDMFIMGMTGGNKIKIKSLFKQFAGFVE